MKISFITTVFNEEKTIERFMDSLFAQTTLPDEIVVVDGGSSDGTIARIRKYEFKNKKIKVKLLTKKGNRSVGRNHAIENASGNIIVCSDAGNILDHKWIKNISEPFTDSSVDVVAGYYKGLAKNIFQKCLIPYILVMPDKVDVNNFLPATRSVAFRKYIWKKVGGFDEQYSHNEDYVFARKLKKAQAKIVFEKDAIVFWIPRTTFRQAFIMFLRFAYGDAEARIFRPKVTLIFLRYIFGFILLLLGTLMRSGLILNIVAILFILYCLWSIVKNYKYVNDWRAIILLPALQITADIAVIVGTLLALLHMRLPL